MFYLLVYSDHLKNYNKITFVLKASSVDEIIEMEFTTRRNSIKLFTTQAEEIANSMRHIQSRWRLSQPVSRMCFL